MQEYIDTHNATPEGIDTVLRFYTSHNAHITNILYDYRPEDRDNKGIGVLIEYDIRDYKFKFQEPTKTASLGIVN